MTKQEAIDFMIKKVEELERDRLSHQPDPNKQKQEAALNLTEAVRFGGRIPESKKHGPGYAAAADGPEY